MLKILGLMLVCSGLISTAQARPAAQLISELQLSTSSAGLEALQQELMLFVPETAEDITQLASQQYNPAITPFAYAAISNARREELSSILLAKLKETVANLPPSVSPGQQLAGGRRSLDILLIANIINALGEIRYLGSVSYLRELLIYNKGSQGRISFESSVALGKMNDETALNDILGKMAGTENITLSGYGERGINAIVAKIEGHFSSQSADPGGKAERNWLLELLVKSGQRDEAAKNALLRLLTHRLPEVNHSAARALLLSLTSEDKEILTGMLSHRLSAVRMAGLTAIHHARIWEPRFLPVVLKLAADDPDVSVRASAIDEIRNLADFWLGRAALRDAVEPLKELLKDPAPAIRFKAFLALRALTGGFYTYEGMSPDVKALMDAGPAFLPEREIKALNGPPGVRP